MLKKKKKEKSFAITKLYIIDGHFYNSVILVDKIIDL